MIWFRWVLWHINPSRLFNTNSCLYIYIKSIYVVHSISFQTFLYRHLKLVQTLENSVSYCYASYEMTDQFFMISSSNEQLQQELEYTLLKPDCHSWRISKMQSERENTLEERYVIKFCFKLGKMPQKRNALECLSTTFQESSISFWVA